MAASKRTPQDIAADTSDSFVITGQQVGMFPHGMVVTRDQLGKDNIDRLVELGEIAPFDSDEAKGVADPSVRAANVPPALVMPDSTVPNATPNATYATAPAQPTPSQAASGVTSPKDVHAANAAAAAGTPAPGTTTVTTADGVTTTTTAAATPASDTTTSTTAPTADGPFTSTGPGASKVVPS